MFQLRRNQHAAQAQDARRPSGLDWRTRRRSAQARRALRRRMDAVRRHGQTLRRRLGFHRRRGKARRPDADVVRHLHPDILLARQKRRSGARGRRQVSKQAIRNRHERSGEALRSAGPSRRRGREDKRVHQGRRPRHRNRRGHASVRTQRATRAIRQRSNPTPRASDRRSCLPRSSGEADARPRAAGGGHNFWIYFPS